MKPYQIQEQSAHFITCTLVGVSMLAELGQSIAHRKGYTYSSSRCWYMPMVAELSRSIGYQQQYGYINNLVGGLCHTQQGRREHQQGQKKLTC